MSGNRYAPIPEPIEVGKTKDKAPAMYTNLEWVTYWTTRHHAFLGTAANVNAGCRLLDAAEEAEATGVMVMREDDAQRFKEVLEDPAKGCPKHLIPCPSPFTGPRSGRMHKRFMDPYLFATGEPPKKPEPVAAAAE